MYIKYEKDQLFLSVFSFSFQAMGRCINTDNSDKVILSIRLGEMRACMVKNMG